MIDAKACAESMFFFEKKNQKTFDLMERTADPARDSITKVFCFFFSKKKRLPFRSIKAWAGRRP
jgi:hypothetical protein